MIVEGKGKVSPSPYICKLASSEIAYLQDVAQKRDKHRGYSNFQSKWKNGCIANPIFVGLVGEYVFWRALKSNRINATTDIDVLNSGDGGVDLCVCGHLYQVKTRVQRRNRLVRRVSDNGVLQPITCDRFVFCSYGPGDQCSIDGWCQSEQIIESRFEKSYRGNWWNVNVNDADLFAFKDLVLLIQMELMYG